MEKDVQKTHPEPISKNDKFQILDFFPTNIF